MQILEINVEQKILPYHMLDFFIETFPHILHVGNYSKTTFGSDISYPLCQN